MSKGNNADPYLSVADRIRGGLKLTIPEFVVPRPRPSPVPIAAVQAAADDLLTQVANSLLLMGAVGLTSEIASLGQVESVTMIAGHMINLSGLPRAVGDLNTVPIDIGIKTLSERYWRSYYQPRIPDPGTLAKLLVRGYITNEAFDIWMAENGFPHWAAVLLAGAEERMPDLGDLLTLLRRGVIDEASFQHWLMRNGVHRYAWDMLTALRWQIPGAQDIISIYMREGYLEEKWAEIPSEFISNMEQQGYSSFWAKRIWGKHWVLPGVNLLYDMFHKKIINLDTMVTMLKYHDFEPVWRQRLIDNAYNMIPRVDLRRAYRYKMLEAEGLQERYELLGFKPSDAKMMAGIAERWSLERYYTRLETVARSAFRKGKLTENELKSILERINTPTEAVSIMLEAEKLAINAAVLEPAEETRTLTASQICTLYKERILSQDVALTRLLGLGYTPEDATLLLSLSEPRPEPSEQNSQLITAAAAMYKEALIDSNTFEGYLRKAGLSESAIAARKDAEDLRARYDLLQDLINIAKQAFEKDIYTAEDLMERLLAYGMQPEKAQALVALEQLKVLPKPKRVA